MARIRTGRSTELPPPADNDPDDLPRPIMFIIALLCCFMAVAVIVSLSL